MAFKPAKPKPVLTKPIKGFDEAVAASKKSDADTKALDGANKELKAASKELAKARAETAAQLWQGKATWQGVPDRKRGV